MEGEGVNIHAGVYGSKYGTALQAALAPDVSNRWAQKQLTDIFPVVKLLLGCGADITTYVSDWEYGDALTAAKETWKRDKDNFDAFIKLLAPRGSKADVLLHERNGYETDINENLLEDSYSQKLKRRRIL